MSAEKSRSNLSEWAVSHRSMVVFLMLLTALAGTFSFTKLGRLEDPIFSVPMAQVVVLWPGASAEQVRDQVVNRIERKLQDIDGIDYVKSFSRQGYGGITLQLKGGTSAARQDAAWYQARKKIGDIRAELPDGVRGPFFNDEFSDVYSTLYAVKGPGLPMADLLAVAEDVKRSLQSVAMVNKVDVIGRQPEKVYVEFSSRKLASLGLTPQTIASALSGRFGTTPAGVVDGRPDRVFIRAPAEHGLDAIRNLPLDLGQGRTIRLADVAEIVVGHEDPPPLAVRRNGEPVLTLGVTISRQANLVQVGQALNARLGELRQSLPQGIAVEQYADQPSIIEDSIWEFERSFLEALVIVLAVSFFALGWRTGIVVAIAVPLVLGLVAVVMQAAGWTLDRISLGALIVALGLLVDDAIIIVESMVVKVEEGWERVKAATYAYTTTAFPMLSGTLLTVAGFMPVGFARSTSGEYAGGLFWIVGLALLASWIVAVLFTPTLAVILLPKHLEGHVADPYDKPIYRRFKKLLEWSLNHRIAVLVTTVVLLVAAVMGIPKLQQQFFPTASRLELLVELRLREGASVHATHAEVRRMEQLLGKTDGIAGYTAYVGGSSPRFYISLAPELPNPSFAQFVVQTKDLPSRDAVRSNLQALLDEGREFPDARGRVTLLEFGPPIGFPVQFRVLGPEPDEVRRIAYKVRGVMEASPLLRGVQLEWDEKVRTVRLRINEDEIRRLGLARADVERTLQMATAGVPAAQLLRGEETIDVVLRADSHERRALDELGSLSVPTRTGGSVPLSQVARLEVGFEEPVIWRRNRAMALTVRADVVAGTQAPSATQQLWAQLDDVVKALPPGYAIERGGAWEENSKAQQAIFAVFPYVLGVMLFLLMAQLQSFRRMGLVLLTMPFGIVGAVPVLLLFNAPFGFVALLGLLALGGMIMRNTIILVDQIDQDIRRGDEPWRAVIDATVRRARPVVLTAAAAILGMIPLSRSLFWGPMAYTIMGGLVMATLLTLVVVPAAYAVVFKVRKMDPSTV